MTWDQNRIKELRKKMNVSQTEFSRLLGCRQQTVSEWELGIYAPANAYGRLLELLEKDFMNKPSSSLDPVLGIKNVKSNEVMNLTQSARSHFDKFFEDDMTKSN